MTPPLSIVILGLSITSSWGNGHATTYRALVRALVERGHRVLFLEREVPWYAANRDLPQPPHGRTALYGSLDELERRFRGAVREADLVILGSYVPEGAAVGAWMLRTASGVRAFYDIDTPITLRGLADGSVDYISRDLIAGLDLYLSFAGGRILERLTREFGARVARPLYCAVDPDLYRPEATETRWDLGYLGTYSADRQPALESLLLRAARHAPSRRFIVAGPQYPPDLVWPPNVERIEHLPPAGHRRFYSGQRFTLNITREDMIRMGHAPSVRLFEAAACATAIISDEWEGLETFFEPGKEILTARETRDTLRHLTELDDAERIAIGRRARQRVLACHTAAHRARELEGYVSELSSQADAGGAGHAQALQ